MAFNDSQDKLIYFHFINVIVWFVEYKRYIFLIFHESNMTLIKYFKDKTRNGAEIQAKRIA